jgi:hypothetical protein
MKNQLSDQAIRVLSFIKNNRGVAGYEIAGNCHAPQYNARISEIREYFGCTHGQTVSPCTSYEHVISKNEKFIYRKGDGVDMSFVREEMRKQRENRYKFGLYAKEYSQKPIKTRTA